jgi:hypothetical protein
MWIVYSGMMTDPFIATRSDGRRRLISNDLEAIRERLTADGLTQFGPRHDDPSVIIEYWAKSRWWAYRGLDVGQLAD